MTILNVVASPSRVLVAVDTIIAAPNGVRCEQSKMVPLLHLNAVIAMRGHTLLLHNIYSGCFGLFGDLDSLLRDMPARLQHCYERAPAADLETPGGEFMSEQVVVAGWSPARAQMVAMDYLLDRPGGQFYLRKEIDSWCLAPKEGFAKPTAFWLGEEDLHTIAIAQANHALSVNPEGGFGGRLLVADLTRDSLAISSRALPGYS